MKKFQNRKTRRIKWRGAVMLAVFLLFGRNLWAAAPESITGDDVISVQVSGGIEGVTSPFIVPGESLISLVTDMVDFETEGTNIVYHRPTGKLFVKNTADNIEMVDSILKELRKYVADEILIEARVIEVTDFEGKDLGVELQRFGYDVGLANAHGSLGITGADAGGRGNRGDLTDFGVGEWSDDNPLSQDEEFDILGFLDTAQFDLDVIIRALGKVVNLNTLSAPRISCFNNQRANIQVVRTQAYVSDIDVVVSEVGDSVAGFPEPVISEAQSGIVLDITPNISTTREYITMDFHPVVIDLDLTPSTIIIPSVGGGNASATIFFPDFVTRSVDTSVTIPDGGTVVIGGLMTQTEKNDVRKVPFLGDIPLLGNLFKTETKFNEKKNLLFFITAKIKENHRSF